MRTLREEGRIDGAFEIAVRYPSLHDSFGLVWQVERDWPEKFQAWVVANPDNPDVDYFLGLLSDQRGETDRAYLHMRRALARATDPRRIFEIEWWFGQLKCRLDFPLAAED